MTGNIKVCQVFRVLFFLFDLLVLDEDLVFPALVPFMDLGLGSASFWTFVLSFCSAFGSWLRLTN